MPYLKIPEFKHNEVISHSDFNEATSKIQSVCSKLDGFNFKDEAFGEFEVPDKTSLTVEGSGGDSRHPFTSKAYWQMLHGDGSVSVPNPFTYPSTSPITLAERYNYPFSTKISVRNMERGEKLIVRASLRLGVPDMGARTYYNGKPCTIQLALCRYLGDPDDVVDTNTINADIIRQTEQRFRFAFTDKMPSASSLSGEALEGATYTVDDDTYDMSGHHRGRDSTYGESLYGSVDGWWYRDNRGGDKLDPGDTYDDHHPTTAGTMNFPAQFNYTACHLYEHDVSDKIDVSFFLLAYISGMDPGMPEDTGAGGKKGCLTPIRLPVDFMDYTITAYPVRR